MGKLYLKYTVKVTLQEWKVSHVLSLSGSSTLEDLHTLIQDLFEFDDDHLYGFFMDNRPYSEDAYYAPGDDEGRCADQVTLDELSLRVGSQFLYIFDFGDEWKFTIRIQKIERTDKEATPMILESQGANPSQYGEADDEDADTATVRSSTLPLTAVFLDLYKEELHHMCKLYDAPYKAAWNKTKLAEALIQSWKQDPESMLRIFSRDEVEYLLDIWNAKEGTPIDIKFEMLQHFQKQCLLDFDRNDGAVEIHYYEQAKELFCSYLKSHEGKTKRDWYADLEVPIVGYMWYYGLVEEGILFAKVCQYLDTELDMAQFHFFLWQRYIWDGVMHRYVDPGSGSMFVSFVDNEELDKAILNKREQHQVEYRELSKKEVTDSYYTGGLRSLDSVKDFYLFMANSVFDDEEEANTLVAVIIGMFKVGAPLEEIVDAVLPPASKIGTKKRKQAIYLLQNTVASLPDYGCKGYTPNEIRFMESNLQVIHGGQSDKKK